MRQRKIFDLGENQTHESKSGFDQLLFYYSRTPVTRTLKGDEKRFELVGVRVIRVDRKFNFSCK